MGINLFDLYHVYSNIFPLVVKLGRVYSTPYIDNNFDRSKFVRHGDKLYSPIWYEGCETTEPDIYVLQKLVYKNINNKLITNKFVYKGAKNKTFYKLDDEIPHKNSTIFKIFNGFVYNLPIIDNQLCICINHTLSIIFYSNIKYLIKNGVPSNQFINIFVRYKKEDGKYYKGFLKEINQKSATINDNYTKENISISLEFVFPEVRPETISYYLRQLKLEENLTDLMRDNSFLSSKTASIDRASSIFSIVNMLKNEKICPLSFGDFEIDIDDEPIFVKGP